LGHAGRLDDRAFPLPRTAVGSGGRRVVIDDWDWTRCFICRDDAEKPTSRLAYEGPSGTRKYPAHAECRDWAMRARRDMAPLTGVGNNAGVAQRRGGRSVEGDWDAVEDSYDGRFALLLGMAG
jgi:hypothetical protein